MASGTSYPEGGHAAFGSADVTSKPSNELALDKFLDHRLFDTFLKATSVCDKFFNCAYVTKQLEDELWQQDGNIVKTASTLTCRVSADPSQQSPPDNADMRRVWSKMEKSFQVEVYRKFLFDESSFDLPSDDEDDSANEKSNLTTTLLYPCGNQEDTESIPDLQRTRS